MKLYMDNIIYGLQRFGGISVYWSEIWKRLLRDNIDALAIEPNNKGKNYFRGKFDIPLKLVQQEVLPQSITRFLPIHLNMSKDTLLHSSYYRRATSSKVAHVQTCYDFIYERYRYGPAQWVHTVQKNEALRSASGIICISESTQRDIQRFLPNINIEKTRVIHLGASKSFCVLQSDARDEVLNPMIGVGDPYCLFVGERSKYKNFAVAIDAMARCKGYRLILVGGGRLKQSEELQLQRSIPKRWLHLKNVSTTALNALYNGAHVLIYPSNYEGFGIPVIESMSAGCPVIALNASSIPEIAGEAGLLLEKADSDATAAFIFALEDVEYRRRIVSNGLLNVRRFCWEKCYQETLDFYRHVGSFAQLK